MRVYLDDVPGTAARREQLDLQTASEVLGLAADGTVTLLLPADYTRRKDTERAWEELGRGDTGFRFKLRDAIDAGLVAASDETMSPDFECMSTLCEASTLEFYRQHVGGFQRPLEVQTVGRLMEALAERGNRATSVQFHDRFLLDLPWLADDEEQRRRQMARRVLNIALLVRGLCGDSRPRRMRIEIVSELSSQRSFRHAPEEARRKCAPETREAFQQWRSWMKDLHPRLVEEWREAHVVLQAVLPDGVHVGLHDATAGRPSDERAPGMPHDRFLGVKYGRTSAWFLSSAGFFLLPDRHLEPAPAITADWLQAAMDEILARPDRQLANPTYIVPVKDVRLDVLSAEDICDMWNYDGSRR